ncbi:MAG: transporter substrate-binding protein [Microbacteriaceae bacterium]|jgi:raffinose/stachyose/melibiose transport system substrate-binding protein|nr:transporter substrate-binding protein [Microbacteriaceae bacterium]
MIRRSSQWKPLAIAAAGVAVAIALAGCAGGSSTTSGSSDKITSKSMTFVTDQGGPAGAKYRQLIKEFEKANPGYKVNMEILPGDSTYNSVLTSRMSSGKSPDLFEIINGPQSAKPFTNAHLLTDLGDQAWVKNLTPVVADAAKTYSGHTYGFITQIDASGFFYNKDLFAKYNVKVPTNWSELQAAIATFQTAGVIPIGMGGKDGWPVNQLAYSMAAQQSDFAPGNSTGPALVAGTKKFSAVTGWKKTLDSFSDLVKDKAFDPNASGITWPASATDFDKGNVAMFYQGDFAIPAIRDGKPSFDVGMFPLPYNSSAGVTVSYGSELAIPAKAPNAGLAKKFLTFLAEKKNYQNYLTSAAAFSSMKNVSGKLDPALAEVAPAVAKKSVEALSWSGLSTATSAALQAGAVAILAGNGTTDAALSGLDSAQATN